MKRKNVLGLGETGLQMCTLHPLRAAIGRLSFRADWARQEITHLVRNSGSRERLGLGGFARHSSERSVEWERETQIQESSPEALRVMG